MRKPLAAILLLVVFSSVSGQKPGGVLSGKVSFVSSRNIYVRFGSTSGIAAGDTLFISYEGKMIPVLKVDNLSSVSCVCTPVSELPLAVDHLIIARVAPVPAETVVKPVTAAVVPLKTDEAGTDTARAVTPPVNRMQEIRGSIAAASYTDSYSAGNRGSQRFRYTLSLNVKNVAGSKVSVSSYVSFRHKVGEWQQPEGNMAAALKVYDLSVSYELSGSARVSAGRRLNPKIAGIGVSDGIQFEKSLGKVSVGALAGFRPDFADFGFNSHLFQYGAFVTAATGSSKTFTESTLAFMQQMNGSATDRRFIYFQHSNSLVENLNMLAAFEVDLYRLQDDKPQGTFSLTGLYLSLRYRPARGVSVSASYDARRNVIYYETFRSFTGRILEDEMRQGYRLGASWRINSRMMAGINSGYRFMKTDPSPSANLNGYYTFSRVPVINISATLSGTLLSSGFADGYLAGVSLSKSFLEGALQTGAGYHYVNYAMPESLADVRQHIAEANMSWQVSEKVSLQLCCEAIAGSDATYGRLWLQARKRF